MKRKLLFFPFLLMFFLTVNFIQASNVRSQTFNAYFPLSSSLGFQNGNSYVLLTVTTGNINSSLSSLTITDGGGQFVFTANETASFRITHTVTTVKVAGDNDNELRAVGNETIINIQTNDRVSIIWDLTSPIWLPIGFIMGIVGLFSIFGGSLYLVNEMKQKNYEEGFQNGVIFMALGIALVLVWLWP